MLATRGAADALDTTIAVHSRPDALDDDADAHAHALAPDRAPPHPAPRPAGEDPATGGPAGRPDPTGGEVITTGECGPAGRSAVGAHGGDAGGGGGAGAGRGEEVELVPGGRSRRVTEENKADYVAAYARYRMVPRAAPRAAHALPLAFCGARGGPAGRRQPDPRAVCRCIAAHAWPGPHPLSPRSLTAPRLTPAPHTPAHLSTRGPIHAGSGSPYPRGLPPSSLMFFLLRPSLPPAPPPPGHLRGGGGAVV